MGRRPKNQTPIGARSFNQENVQTYSDGKVLNKAGEMGEMQSNSVEVQQKQIREGSLEVVIEV